MIIAQISDLHIRAPGQLAYRRVDTAPCLERCVAQLAHMTPRPDLVLATGDLVDVGLPEEYRHLRALLAPLPMPVYLIPGNHDRREPILAEFADHPYLPRQGTFLHYVIEDHPVRLIGLDTLVVGQGGGHMCDERLAWLAARLEEAPRRPTMIFMHHAPFHTGIEHMDRLGLEGAEADGRTRRAASPGRAGGLRAPAPAHLDALARHPRHDFSKHRASGGARPPGKRSRRVLHGAARLPPPRLEQAGRTADPHELRRRVSRSLSLLRGRQAHQVDRRLWHDVPLLQVRKPRGSEVLRRVRSAPHHRVCGLQRTESSWTEVLQRVWCPAGAAPEHSRVLHSQAPRGEDPRCKGIARGRAQAGHRAVRRPQELDGAPRPSRSRRGPPDSRPRARTTDGGSSPLRGNRQSSDG